MQVNVFKILSYSSYLVIPLFLGAVIASCTSEEKPKMTEDYEGFQFTGDLADCKAYRVYYRSGSYNIMVVRCPHSTTTTGQSRHTSPVTTIAD